MLTRRGMLRHVGAAGAAAATLRGGKRGTQRRDVRPAARRLRLWCFPSRRPRPYAAGGSYRGTAPGSIGPSISASRAQKEAWEGLSLCSRRHLLCGAVWRSRPRPMFRSRWGWRVKRADLIMHIRPHNLSGAISRTADRYTAETRFYADRASRLQTYTRETVLCFSQPVSFVPCNIRPDNIGLNPYKRTIFSVLARDRMLACARLA
jgi:hypothetical protein